jgi:hypothetical protein
VNQTKKLRRQLRISKLKIKNLIARFLHRENLPLIPNKFSSILLDLQTNAISISSLDELMIPNTDLAISSLDRILSQIKQFPVISNFNNICASQPMIDAEPDAIRWGLDQDLLALVKNYIGLPIAYRGFVLRQDIHNGMNDGTRQWHIDNEDISILKIIIYLNEVDLQSGPFEYIPIKYTPQWKVPDDRHYYTDIEFEKLVPKKNWTQCIGPRGTVIFVDTCRLFHRGMTPISHDRNAVFYCFNSVSPVNRQYCDPLFDRNFFINANCLSSRQLAVLDYK